MAPPITLDASQSNSPPARYLDATHSLRWRARSFRFQGVLGCAGSRLVRPFHFPARVARVEVS